MNKTNMIKSMRFWLFGIFLLIFAATTAYLGLIARWDFALALRAGFPIWGITAILCVAWFYIYKLYLNRKP